MKRFSLNAPRPAAHSAAERRSPLLPLGVVLVSASLLSLPVLAQNASPSLSTPPAPTQSPRARSPQAPAPKLPAPGSLENPLIDVEVVEVSAEVVAVDQENRLLTLKRADGETLTIPVGPEVKNLAQVKAGDIVVSRYTRAVGIALKKSSGLRSEVDSQQISTARPGDKPSITGTRNRSIVADIVAINPVAGFVTVKTPHGNLIEARFKDTKALAGVKVGEQVELIYDESIVIAVENAPKN